MSLHDLEFITLKPVNIRFLQIGDDAKQEGNHVDTNLKKVKSLSNSIEKEVSTLRFYKKLFYQRFF